MILQIDKKQKLASFNSAIKGKKSFEIIRISINFFSKKKICYVCSFGAESAIILHMISKIDKSFPIIFLNTSKLFQETIIYKNLLKDFFQLKNIIEIFPSKHKISKYDPNGELWSSDPDMCCDLRKVIPLNSVLSNFDAWFSGRKSYHNEERKKQNIIEIQDDKFLISPLINWERSKINEYFAKFNIPPHPLKQKGFSSIGCKNCTIKSQDELNVRSGRWVSFQKTECGIHRKKTNGSFK